jgi:hypothetical protein
MNLTQQDREWLEGVIEKTARAVVKEHRSDCKVGELAGEIWGNGKPGLKTRVDRLEQAKARGGTSRGGSRLRGFLAGCIQPGLAALITAVLMWAFGAMQASAAASKPMPPPAASQPNK